MKKILLVGATSAIAQATARIFAQRGDALYLVARNQERLVAVASDLQVRGASQVGYEALDMNLLDEQAAMLERATAALDGLDTVLVAHGTLPDQAACEASQDASLEALSTNGLSVIALLTLVANQFEAQGHGCIVAISSVAGDRGRQSNYVYGTAKAAVTVFMQGLRNRLEPKGVQVITIKPGFVDTPMTAEFDKGLLWAQPETIAAGIYKAIRKKRDVVYLPGFWRLIMWVIRSIPEGIFKRLKL
ncbi:MAG: SDR family oxidoreductase [Salinisphaeraceae bacterium]|nr:SDR family oxidoreductase [Salinisphaeraceae bacterium]